MKNRSLFDTHIWVSFFLSLFILTQHLATVENLQCLSCGFVISRYCWQLNYCMTSAAYHRISETCKEARHHSLWHRQLISHITPFFFIFWKNQPHFNAACDFSVSLLVLSISNHLQHVLSSPSSFWLAGKSIKTDLSCRHLAYKMVMKRAHAIWWEDY